MTYKQIEATRELRLWIGQVIVPAVAAGAVLCSNPETKAALKQKVEDVKNRFKPKKPREGDV